MFISFNYVVELLCYSMVKLHCNIHLGLCCIVVLIMLTMVELNIISYCNIKRLIVIINISL
jgi:hypothetical protein